ncbi:hypothetical protein M0813_12581 [Anaeramoeba flamelloides]|uniref:Uncharacterized protein n=1 Tax=Anaeramoeba flamelloides TaxID=1746091 RepID=A0ABQ8ZC43_9EUKA|nr:hypothetical protein M0813_12581 [Anaeramoeba flamelloides]
MNSYNSNTNQETEIAIQENNPCLRELNKMQNLIIKCKTKIENNSLLWKEKELSNQKEITKLQKEVKELKQEINSLETQKEKEDERKNNQIKKKNYKTNNPKSTNLPIQIESPNEEIIKRNPKKIYIFQPDLNLGKKAPTYKDWIVNITTNKFVKKILFEPNLLGLTAQEMGEKSYQIDEECKESVKTKQNIQKDFTTQAKEIVNKYLLQTSSKLSTVFEEIKINLGKFWFDLICEKFNLKNKDFYNSKITNVIFFQFLQELLDFSHDNEDLKELHKKIEKYRNDCNHFYFQKIWYNYLVYFYLGAYLQRNKKIKSLWNIKFENNNSNKPWLYSNKYVSNKIGYEFKAIQDFNSPQQHIIILPIIYKTKRNNKELLDLNIGKKGFIINDLSLQN